MKHNKDTDAVIPILLIVLGGIFSTEIILAVQMVLLLFKKKLRLSKWFMLIIMAITIHSVINVLLGNSQFDLMIKQILGISISFVFFSNYVNENNYMSCIKAYLNAAVFISVFSIIQQIARLLNITYIYNLQWLVKEQLSPTPLYRSVTIFREPAECALFLVVAVYIAVYCMVGKYRNTLKSELKLSLNSSLIIIVGFLFTFSSIGYVGLLIIGVFIWFDYKHTFKQLFISIMIIIAFIALYELVPEFRMRIDDTLNLFFVSGELAENNLSSQTLYINFRIAIMNLVNTFGLGSGIGSHQIAYENYKSELNLTGVYLFLNSEDANSLALRVMSELGIFAVIGICIWIIKNKSAEVGKINYIINFSCIVYFALQLLRYGHYFYYGIWFWVWIYLLTRHENKTMAEGKEKL